jgi:hypothetical protein
MLVSDDKVPLPDWPVLLKVRSRPINITSHGLMRDPEFEAHQHHITKFEARQHHITWINA